MKGKPLDDQVIFIGGVSENRAVIHFLTQLLDLRDRLWVPAYNRELGAIGAARRAERQWDLDEIITQASSIRISAITVEVRVTDARRR